MRNTHSIGPHSRWARRATLSAGVVASLLLFVAARDADRSDPPGITTDHWGWITAPVYGQPESNPAYSSAEILAGPNKFGNYFSGVLPNGRMVKPAGTTIQIGMNPLGIALTPDGRFLIASDDDEREGGFISLRSPTNFGGYSLTVVDTSSMKVVSTVYTSDRFFEGLAVTGQHAPYTVWVAGGPDNDVKLYSIDAMGSISKTGHIPITPALPDNSGYVSNYNPGSSFNTKDSSGNKPPVPSGFSRTTNPKTTFPAGLALSPDGKFLYVACNGDNSVAVIDTAALTVVNQTPVGYFPYSVSVNSRGDKVLVSNWGITEYKFKNPSYSGDTLSALATTGTNSPDGFYVPVTSTSGANPKTSSISYLTAPNGNGTLLSLRGSIYQGHRLDSLHHVGDTHPSATAIVHRGGMDVLYVTKSNNDSLGVILLNTGRRLPDVDLSPFETRWDDGHSVHGAYPNAIVVSPDSSRAYVAEAGLNSVAVIDTEDPSEPSVIGRIPTDWYPTALALSADGRFLYVANAKGIGEDINPNTDTAQGNPPPTGLASFSGATSVDSNYMYGTLQQIDLSATRPDNRRVLANNFSIHPDVDTSVVPAGGRASQKIKHVFFILHENKTFDSMLGNLGTHFGAFAGMTFNQQDGSAYTAGQYTGVSLNTQALAIAFATAVNYYSESEESDAGHQFCASGIASDYTEKTLLVKTGRGLLVNKNFEPEDYPESGYIFNNAARNGVSFKDYGALIRIEGTDTGTSTPTTLNDPTSGLAGAPTLQADGFHAVSPVVNFGDYTSSTEGLGQTYFLALPILAVLGTNNPNGQPRLDVNYPGYNFNISDQRRAQEFINDFDRMVQANTLPEFIYIYQPNDHTGGVQAPNANDFTSTGVQEIADGDVGLGMVVEHIMKSSVYYDSETSEGSAIFITYDDAQSTLDHIHPHRTPLIVVSPFAKPGYVATRHYSTASIVKTEELLLGLPPNNLGDLLATDLRDMFQADYNGITADQIAFNKVVSYSASLEGKYIWALVDHLDTSAPDHDSARLGALIRLSMQADELHNTAAREHRLHSKAYLAGQKRLYEKALKLVKGPAPRDCDG